MGGRHQLGIRWHRASIMSMVMLQLWLLWVVKRCIGFFPPNWRVEFFFFFEFLPAKLTSRFFLFWISSRQIENRGVEFYFEFLPAKFEETISILYFELLPAKFKESISTFHNKSIHYVSIRRISTNRSDSRQIHPIHYNNHRSDRIQIDPIHYQY